MSAQQVEDIYATIGQHLQQLRARLGWTQEKLARRCGLKQNSLSQIEQATRRVSIVELERISLALGVPLARLFNRRIPASKPKDYLIAEEVADHLQRSLSDRELTERVGRTILEHFRKHKRRSTRFRA